MGILATGFSEGDRVQLAAGQYFLQVGVGVSGERGVGVYLNSYGGNSWDGHDELVALVIGSKTLTYDDLVYVDVIG